MVSSYALGTSDVKSKCHVLSQKKNLTLGFKILYDFRMNIPDLINSGYEAFGSVMTWLNVATVYKHKQVRGIHLGSMMFFTSWGFWNLYYYPHLHQWASFAGGLSIFLANIVWLSLAVYYSRKVTS